jgi:hypothetical protein
MEDQTTIPGATVNYEMRRHWAAAARAALAEYEDWVHSAGKYADVMRPLSPSAAAGLACSAAWLLEVLEAQR